VVVSGVNTTKAHDTPKACCECGRDKRDGYLAPHHHRFRWVLLTSSARCKAYSSACKTEAGFRKNKGGSCGAQQATKAVEAQMVWGEGSCVCAGDHQAVLVGRER